MDQQALQQVQLPGPLGGCGLRVPIVLIADAAYLATFMAHKFTVQRLAMELGRPHSAEVDAEPAYAARQTLDAA